MNWLDRLLALLRPAPVPPPPPPPPPPNAVGFREQLLLLFNAARTDHRLPYLEESVRLDAAASDQSSTQAGRLRMGHDGEWGNTVRDRLRREGYAWSSAAENVAAGYPDVPGVFAGWMGSPPHRAAILGPYRQVGFGVATGTDGLRYWTAVFAVPDSGFTPSGRGPDPLPPSLSGPLRPDATP